MPSQRQSALEWFYHNAIKKTQMATCQRYTITTAMSLTDVHAMGNADAKAMASKSLGNRNGFMLMRFRHTDDAVKKIDESKMYLSQLNAVKWATTSNINRCFKYHNFFFLASKLIKNVWS